MKAAKPNPLFTRSEKRRVRRKVAHKIKGAARSGLARLFGIPLSPGLGGRPSRRPAHRGTSKPASLPVRGDVIEALRGQGYSKAQAERMTPAARSDDSFESLFRRAMAKNPGELIIFGNPARGYTRRQVEAAKRQGNPIPVALLTAFEGALGTAAGSSVARTLSKKQRKRRNPGSVDRAEDLYRQFHGREPSGVYELHTSAKRRRDYTILGPLVAIGVNAEKYDQVKRGASKTQWENYKVEHWDQLSHLAFLTPQQIAFCKKTLEDPARYLDNCPLLASSPNGKQLYAITPDPPVIDLSQFDTDASKDFVDLGEATFVVYIAKKPDVPYEWVHELGEEGGTRPRLMYNRLGRELFFIGGSYTVEAPGIVN